MQRFAQPCEFRVFCYPSEQVILILTVKRLRGEQHATLVGGGRISTGLRKIDLAVKLKKSWPDLIVLKYVCNVINIERTNSGKGKYLLP